MSGYHAHGGRIVDDEGRRIPLRGVNWFGFETATHVVRGLGVRNWLQMIDQMTELGFDAVRLPVGPATLAGAPTVGIDAKLNPDLAGLDALEVLDRLVAELSRRGFHVLIDHHGPADDTLSELWTAPGFTEKQWLADLALIARRYAKVEGFLGVDLKNEPHGRATWGTGKATDWNRAAERGAAVVLAEAPDRLVFVEGVAENPVASSEGGHWWGGNLEPFAEVPLEIPADRLVLSPHVYGPDVAHQDDFDHWRFPKNLTRVWDRHFGYLAGGEWTIVVGEFGGRCGDGDPRDHAWHEAIVDYFIRRGMGSAFYWCWNPDSEDTGGILADDWRTPHPAKMRFLDRLWRSS